MDADLEAQPERTNPVGQLLRGVGGTIIQDEMEDADPFAPQTGEQHLQEQLKFPEPLPLETARERFPAVYQQAGEQLHGTLAVIPVADMQGMPRTRRSRTARGFSSLDRGLLVRADDDVALPAQLLRALVQVQNRDGLFQESRISRPLPAAILPGLDLLGSQPALQGRGRDAGHDTALDHGGCELTRRPPRQRFTRVAGQCAREGGHSGADRGGEKSAARLAAGLPDTPAPLGCGSATSVPSGRYNPRPGQWPRYSTRDARRPAGGSSPAPPARRVLSDVG